MCAHTSQDLLKRKVVQTLEKEMKKKLTVTAGWYTQTQMVKRLDFTETLSCKHASDPLHMQPQYP